MITDNLKPSLQCVSAAKPVQTVLGQISRAFHYRDRYIFVRLYKQYVQPHLEFSMLCSLVAMDSSRQRNSGVSPKTSGENGRGAKRNGIWRKIKNLD